MYSAMGYVKEDTSNQSETVSHPLSPTVEQHAESMENVVFLNLETIWGLRKTSNKTVSIYPYSATESLLLTLQS